MINVPGSQYKPVFFRNYSVKYTVWNKQGVFQILTQVYLIQITAKKKFYSVGLLSSRPPLSLWEANVKPMSFRRFLFAYFYIPIIFRRMQFILLPICSKFWLNFANCSFKIWNKILLTGALLQVKHWRSNVLVTKLKD